MDRCELERELERLHPACFGWALSCCEWRRAEAEEVLQDAYLKLLEGKARFDGRASFKTFLLGVIRLTAHEHLRRWRWRCRRLIAVPDEASWLDPAQSQEADLAQRERAAELVGALQRLPARQREVLDLVFYHGLSVREAGEVMRVTTGTAAAHYDRGKVRLREMLGGRSDRGKGDMR